MQTMLKHWVDIFFNIFFKHSIFTRTYCTCNFKLSDSNNLCLNQTAKYAHGKSKKYAYRIEIYKIVVINLKMNVPAG